MWACSMLLACTARASIFYAQALAVVKPVVQEDVLARLVQDDVLATFDGRLHLSVYAICAEPISMEQNRVTSGQQQVHPLAGLLGQPTVTVAVGCCSAEC